jgi:hypothetical protein
MSARIAFAENVDISEREFLHRELGISLVPFSTIYEKVVVPSNLILILNSPSTIVEQVLALDSKLIIFVLGNETYQNEDISKLLGSKKLLRMYTPYFPKKPSLLNVFFMLVGNLIDGGLTFRAPAGGMIRTLINGFRRWRIAIEYSNFSKVKAIPLGYTNRFVAELEELGISNTANYSIFERAPLFPLQAKPNSISFCGTRDSWCRDLAISQLRKTIMSGRVNGLVQVDPIWGGESRPGGLDYCKSISQSRAVLCPPGYSSNYTFRFWESLLLGSFPICLPLSAQDWHLWQPSSWDLRRNRLSSYSWKLQLTPKRIRSSTVEEYEFLVDLALTEGLASICEVRRFLSSVERA